MSKKSIIFSISFDIIIWMVVLYVTFLTPWHIGIPDYAMTMMWSACTAMTVTTILTVIKYFKDNKNV